jgi:DNA polymerase IV
VTPRVSSLDAVKPYRDSLDEGCTILHVDMDAFFASVALRDRPELRAVPVVIGGGGGRGVVLCATYPARAYGVTSGMPMSRARRLCPRLVVVAPGFTELSSVSSAIVDVFRSVTSLVQPISLDEAFLDVSGSMRAFASPTAVGEYLRARIADEQRITCSVGVAATTQLAKLASRRAKPDGIFVVPRDQATAFLHPLAVDDLWGVGAKTAVRLRKLGLHTVGDVAHAPVSILQRALGPVAGAHLHRMAWGTDHHPVVARRAYDEPDRSIGAEETFGRDVSDPVAIERELLRLAVKVAYRMRAGEVAGRTVVVKVRFSDFATITRSRTLRAYTNLTPEIHATAVALFEALKLQRARIRLVGVRVQGLADAATVPRQPMLGEREHGWDDAESATDRVIGRFGKDALRRGSLVATRRL